MLQKDAVEGLGSMRAFISHNKTDREKARLLAIALVEQGVDTWFDEWNLLPGDSLVEGIEEGLVGCDVFILVWSEAASQSNWVGAELRAHMRRRIDEQSLRIVPVVLDQTVLPPLVAEYKGFFVSDDTSLEEIAFKVAGSPIDLDIARRLQTRLIDLSRHHQRDDPLPYMVCPSCASTRLRRSSATDHARDHTYLIIRCEECGWGDWSE